MDIVETLQAEHTELTAKLAELDQRVETERPALVAQISKLGKAIKALTKSSSTGERKPMSEAGREAIRAGLERARAAKQAQGAGSTEAKPASTPAPGTDKKGPVSTEKGPVRAN